MADEHVFTVAGTTAVPATPITLAEAGFTERAHLQEWVIAHPEMLGPGVMIVTLEFDQWRSSSGGDERDRLDILGLDVTGRLVIAELKRDVAPDTVAMQAIKYSAMASRFTPETLAAQHAKFLSRRENATTPEAARERLEAHCESGLVSENIAKPRIVLLASSFPSVVTATAVWLNEMSLEISLMQLRAYQAEDKVVVTVSQLFPVADVEQFMVAPVRAAKQEADLPEVPWTKEELRRLRARAGPTVLAALDLCAAQAGAWVPLREVEQRAGREHAQARADLAGLTMMVKRSFGRSNWPFVAQWAAGGEQQSYYSMDPDLATAWKELSAAADNGDALLPPPHGSDGDAEVDRDGGVAAGSTDSPADEAPPA